MAGSIWKSVSRILARDRSRVTGKTPLSPHLSKSRYLTGLQCDRRLWLSWHDQEKPAPSPPGSIFAVGHEVGRIAHALFPRGVLVGGGPAEFDKAVGETAALIADTSVEAIFEAAFVFERVRIRADILERLGDGRWALHEVKSSTGLKPENLDDLMVQAYVIEGSGLKLASANLVHINTGYVRGSTGIDAPRLFSSVDATAQVRAGLAKVPTRIEAMHRVLAMQQAPERRPSGHCFKPYECEFWSRCTQAKPADWVWYLPHLRADQFSALEALDVESIRSIPDDFPLSAAQQRVVGAWRKGDIVVHSGLSAALPSYRECGYLDFETLSPALPLFEGSRPYQRQPAQWSLHRRAAGKLQHEEFLADLRSDPARKFAEALLAAAAFEGPVFVYSSFERSLLRDLATKLPDLAEQINALTTRLFDLLPVVRAHLNHPHFNGSVSIKAIAPILAPEVRYDKLVDVADGRAASEALYRLATGQLQSDETAASLRAALLDYCRLDTLALARVHEALSSLAQAER